MQIEKFVRIRNMSIFITIACSLIMLVCYNMDTSSNNVGALRDYIVYSRQCVENDEGSDYLSDSCSILFRNDSIYKSNPEHVANLLFNSVEEMEEFVDGWTYDTSQKINPYVNAYIKQSLWEYADWCINEESSDYWHMKYIASQKTGAYSYARQIKYKWYKIAYEKAPFVVMLSLFFLIFTNVLCILYGLSGTKSKPHPVDKIPNWHNSVDKEE